MDCGKAGGWEDGQAEEDAQAERTPVGGTEKRAVRD